MLYGYTRVSTVEQAAEQKTSLQEQRRVIAGRAMILGQEVAEVFEDAGVSGATPIDERPSGERLMAVLRPGDVVVAAKLDRLFRSSLDALQTAEKLRDMKVSLWLEDMGGDVTGNGMAKVFFTMAAAFAEFERERIAERMATGKAAKAAKGGYTGGTPPWGYKVEGQGKDAVLVPDPALQREINHVHVMYHNLGWSLRRISKELKDRGVEISHQGVADLLKRTQQTETFDPLAGGWVKLVGSAD